jgi:hypothetical protein
VRHQIPDRPPQRAAFFIPDFGNSAGATGGLGRLDCLYLDLVAGAGSALRCRTTMASPCSAIPMFRTIDDFGAWVGAGAGEFVSALAVPNERRAAITSSFFIGVVPVVLMSTPYDNKKIEP